MDKSLHYPERLQAILNYWFTPDWDRTVNLPPILFPRWFGLVYEPNKSKLMSISKLEQESIDNEIRSHFLQDLSLIDSCYKDSWRKDPQGLLGMVILKDQMARNIFRKKAEAFAFEEGLVDLTKELIREGKDKKYQFWERIFLYLPLEHSEKIEDQILCGEVFKDMVGEFAEIEELKEFAQTFVKYSGKHKIIIEKFGRFPHRNEVLGRMSTEEEISFLKEGGERFGQ